MRNWIQLKIALLGLGSIILLCGCSTTGNGWSPRVPTVDNPEMITGPGTAPSVSGKELFRRNVILEWWNEINIILKLK